ncbi:Phosphoheptose isomerase [subsurface metagenome]
MDLIDRITKIISAHSQVIKDIQSDRGIIGEIERSALIITETLCEGGALFAFGNGGSAADAQHIVAELVGRFYLERPGFKAIALSTDGSIMTSLASQRILT